MSIDQHASGSRRFVQVIYDGPNVKLSDECTMPMTIDHISKRVVCEHDPDSLPNQGGMARALAEVIVLVLNMYARRLFVWTFTMWVRLSVQPSRFNILAYKILFMILILW